MNELLLDSIAVDDEMRITTKRGNEGEWVGKIIEIGKLPVGAGEEEDEYNHFDEGNPQTSKYPFTVLLEEHEGLEVGFHVNLELMPSGEEQTSETIMLPEHTVVIEEEEPYVWAVDVEAETLYKQVVEIAETDDEFLLEIVSGLSPEDYIVDPHPSLEEGKKVEVLDDDSFEQYF